MPSTSKQRSADAAKSIGKNAVEPYALSGEGGGRGEIWTRRRARSVIQTWRSAQLVRPFFVRTCVHVCARAQGLCGRSLE